MKPADRIKAYIKNHGINQSFICQKTGIDKSSLSAKLNGKSRITADDLELICGTLECSPNEFVIPRQPTS
jgi:transcriptional regulator with XRE-family HTH domain